MASYKVIFDVNGDCSWVVTAASAEDAREEGIRLFRADRFWAQRYPDTPPSTVELEPEPNSGSHADLGPYK